MSESDSIYVMVMLIDGDGTSHIFLRVPIPEPGTGKQLQESLLQRKRVKIEGRDGWKIKRHEKTEKFSPDISIKNNSRWVFVANTDKAHEALEEFLNKSEVKT